MKMLLTSLLFFLLFLSATAAENLVRNPSFEQRNAQGKAFAWSVSPPHWELDSSIHLSGTSSLRYTNLDPKTYRYAYCRQTVKVEPGKSYRFGGKVRYSGVRNGYADICLEIIGKNGRVLKGYYPHGPKAFTTEWLEINGMAINIPQDFSSAHIACYAQRYTFGTIWFDDIFLEETEVPLLTRFTSSAYRNITDGGTVTFFIGTNRPVKPEELSQAGLSFTFAGKTSPLKALRTKILPDMLVYEVNTADLPFGRMTVDFRVVGKDGPAEKSLVFEKVKKLPLRKAGIDKNQRFILDGRPFFPLGLYLPVHPLPEEDIKTIADSDINTVLPYAELDAGNLDLMKKYNLNVIYNLKDAIAGKNGSIGNFQKKLLAVKHHPAIICWYLSDEAPYRMIPLLSKCRDLAEKLDPERPTFSCVLNLAELRQYLGTFDIAGSDPYPIPRQDLEMVREWTQKTRYACFNTRSTIMVLQAFNWAYHWKRNGRTAEEVASARAPSYDEMNAMSWMSIAEGANGLIFYSFMDLQRMDHPPEGLKRDDFAARWGDLKKVISGIRRMEDVLLSSETPPALKKNGGSAHIAWRTFSARGVKWLLAVNCNEKMAARAVFAAEDGSTVTVPLKPLEVSFQPY